MSGVSERRILWSALIISLILTGLVSAEYLQKNHQLFRTGVYLHQPAPSVMEKKETVQLYRGL